ncbi:MAG: hypothetical protein CME70_22610 [Halobacteriovorax sp.]|nr:hypothetical protein [Halobacteriovorax sp.]|tara:strand:+ start:51908 stop:52444 length:537 start_codon:yes stop_codon:yes gene_type:complete
MAIGASIYKADLNLSNFNSHFYHDFNLTMAKHPSENEARMMNRLAAFCYCAHEDLSFTKGLSTQEEPELWQKDLTGEILHWIELGLPDEKRIKQALGKSRKVSVFTTAPNTYREWFNKLKISSPKLSIYFIEVVSNGPIDKIVERNMKLSCTIEDNIMHLGNDQERIELKVLNLNDSP